MYFFIFMLIVGFLFEFKLGIIDICVLTNISLNKLEYKYLYLFFLYFYVIIEIYLWVCNEENIVGCFYTRYKYNFFFDYFEEK